MQSFQQRLEETVADLIEAQEMSIILLAEAIEDGKCQFSRGWRGQKQSFSRCLRRQLQTLQRPKEKRSIILLAEAREDGNCQFRRGWRGQKQSFQQRGRSPGNSTFRRGLKGTVANLLGEAEEDSSSLLECLEDRRGTLVEAEGFNCGSFGRGYRGCSTSVEAGEKRCSAFSGME